jgi:hypothetical protein
MIPAPCMLAGPLVVSVAAHRCVIGEFSFGSFFTACVSLAVYVTCDQRLISARFLVLMSVPDFRALRMTGATREFVSTRASKGAQSSRQRVMNRRNLAIRYQ